MLVDVRGRSRNRSRNFDFRPSEELELESEFVCLEQDGIRNLKKINSQLGGYSPGAKSWQVALSN